MKSLVGAGVRILFLYIYSVVFSFYFVGCHHSKYKFCFFLILQLLYFLLLLLNNFKCPKKFKFKIFFLILKSSSSAYWCSLWWNLVFSRPTPAYHLAQVVTPPNVLWASYTLRLARCGLHSITVNKIKLNRNTRILK